MLKNIPVSKTDPSIPAGISINPAASGFTLLEVMISLSIIAIALTAVYSTYTRTISMNIEQKFNITAPVLAAKVVNELENRTLDDLGDDSGDFGIEFEGYAWEAMVETISSETLGVISEDMRSIAVTVTLNEGELAYRVQTIRFMRSGEQS